MGKLNFKRCCLVATCCLFFNCGNSQTTAPAFSTAGFFKLKESDAREVYNFNNGWYFYKGHIKNAEALNFKQSNNWQPVQLPHGTDLLPEEASGGISYQGITWYRKKFKLPASTISKKISLHFEAIMGKCKIWVNGVLVKEHKGGYLPVIVDLPAAAINKTGDNLVAVMADNSDDKTYPPGKAEFTMDFSYFGGIYRDVWLIATNEIHITDANSSNKPAGGGVFVHYENVGKQSAQVFVSTDIINQSNRNETLVSETYLKDEKGNTIAPVSKTFLLAANSSITIEQDFTVTNPVLWHPDAPHLYQLYTVVKDEAGKIVDGYWQYTGIRSIEFKGKEGFWLNGKPFGDKLIGSNHHQDFAYVGNAVPNNLLWRDAKIIRDAGIRILRLAHYPQDPAFMEACDRLGIFTIVATPGWQFWNNDAAFAAYMYDDIRQMIRRDRNHPSVIMWEPVPNETYYPLSFAEKAYQITHEEYPYAGCYAACNFYSAGWEKYDVLFAHPGEVAGKNLRQCTFTREWGDGDFVDNWDTQNASNRAPLSWGEAPQLKQAECFIHPKVSSWETLYAAPAQHLGGCLWHFFDTQRGYHPDEFYGGVVDAFRQPKYVYWLFQSQQNPNTEYVKTNRGQPYTLFIAHDMNPFSPADVTVFTNCDSVRLIVNRADTLVQAPTKSAMPHPPIVFKNVYDYYKWKTLDREGKAAKSTLVAQGFANGKIVATTVNAMAKRTGRIKLMMDMQGAKPVADGSTVVPVIAYMLDENGLVKRLNNEHIKFTVQGEGQIIGDESIFANPRKIEWGTAPVLIKTTLTPGTIKLIATVAFPGVHKPKADTLEITTIGATISSVYNKADVANAFVPAITPSGASPFSASKKIMSETDKKKALKETVKGQEQFEGKTLKKN